MLPVITDYVGRVTERNEFHYDLAWPGASRSIYSRLPEAAAEAWRGGGILCETGTTRQTHASEDAHDFRSVSYPC